MLLICLNCFTQYAPKGTSYNQTCPNCSGSYFYADSFDGILTPLYVSLHKKGYCLEEIGIVKDPKGIYYFMVFFQTWIYRKILQPLPAGFTISRYKYKSYDGPRMIKRFNTIDLQKCENQVPDVVRDLLLWAQGLPQLYKFTAVFETNSLPLAHKLRNILRRQHKFCDVMMSGDNGRHEIIATTTVFEKDDPALVLEMGKVASKANCLFKLVSN